MESNDSPEIPDRGETSDIPGLPSGVKLRKEKRRERMGKTYTDLNKVCKPILSHRKLKKQKKKKKDNSYYFCQS